MIDITIDLETTANGPDNSPEAHWPQNRVILWGWVEPGGPVRTGKNGGDLKQLLVDCVDDGEQVRIIGHNLKFDLKYMMREWPNLPWPEFQYVCTMHRHYRLTGHKDKFISLEELAAYYNFPFTKGLNLGAIISSGIKMEDIPMSDLIPYLEADVKITRDIAYAQDGEDPMLESALILPLADMELLGLKLDKKKATTLMTKLVTSEAILAHDMELFVATCLRWSNGDPVIAGEVKFNAPRTISYLLTGKPVASIMDGKRTLEWKTGFKPLLRTSEFVKFWPGKMPTNLGYPMPAEKLQQIQAAYPTYEYITWVLEYRKVQKLMNTYVGPFLAKTKTLPTIHPKMNVNATATGRLSSSDPNGQNLPPVARELFQSTNGLFHEIDFKQLEVVCLAAITEDPQLIADINNGVDIHFKTGQRVMGWKTPADMKDDERTLVKNVNFGLIYGGGAAGLSLQTGQPKKLIKSLMDGFYARYPVVADWQAKFYKEVARNLKPYDIKDGEQRYHSYVTLPISKRKFHFVESASPKWLRIKTGRKYSFKPTETKNYPVQGFAGGDIVMLALVELHHCLWDEKNTDIRMTVHDSIVVDSDLDVNDLTAIMDKICRKIEAVFNLPFELQFDIKSGKNWR